MIWKFLCVLLHNGRDGGGTKVYTLFTLWCLVRMVGVWSLGTLILLGLH